MKKIISLLICSAILLSVFICTVSAGGDTVITVAGEKYSVGIGDKLTYNVELQSDKIILCGDVKVVYPSDILKADAISVYGVRNYVKNIDNPGEAYSNFSYTKGNDFTEKNLFLQIQFSVASIGEGEIEFVPADFFDMDQKSITKKVNYYESLTVEPAATESSSEATPDEPETTAPETTAEQETETVTETAYESTEAPTAEDTSAVTTSAPEETTDAPEPEETTTSVVTEPEETTAPVVTEPETEATEVTTQAETTVEPAPSESEAETTAPETTAVKPTDMTTKTNIMFWEVKGIKDKTYNGKSQTQSITVTDGVRVADISVTYYNNINVGTAAVAINGKGDYTGMIVKSFKINKAKQPMNVNVSNKTVKAKKLKKKAVIIKAIKVKNAKGKVTYSKYKNGSTVMTYKRLTVNKKTGKITIKKNYYPKGTFKIRVKITAKGNKNYKSKSVVKTIRIKVK